MNGQKPGISLTPEQTRKAQRWVRIAVLSAVVQAWVFIGVVALTVPRLLSPFLALTVLYSIGAPFLLSTLLPRD